MSLETGKPSKTSARWAIVTLRGKRLIIIYGGRLFSSRRRRTTTRLEWKVFLLFLHQSTVRYGSGQITSCICFSTNFCFLSLSVRTFAWNNDRLELPATIDLNCVLSPVNVHFHIQTQMAQKINVLAEWEPRSCGKFIQTLATIACPVKSQHKRLAVCAMGRLARLLVLPVIGFSNVMVANANNLAVKPSVVLENFSASSWPLNFFYFASFDEAIDEKKARHGPGGECYTIHGGEHKEQCWNFKIMFCAFFSLRHHLSATLNLALTFWICLRQRKSHWNLNTKESEKARVSLEY